MEKIDIKISVVVTVLNEAKTITDLLNSLKAQNFPADEILIVDGGSRDGTQQKIQQFAAEFPRSHIRMIEKKGNRSVGRNEGIFQAKNHLIAITDAGCIAHTDWLEKFVERIQQPHSHREFVLAGYYDAQPKNAFEEAVVPYVFEMPDKVRPQTFLPVTRSMLMTKSVWEKLGGFDEDLCDNEDFEFAQRVRKNHIPIFFVRDAKVEWIPRSNMQQFCWMIFRFARGDTYAGIWRPRVLFLFGRYLFAFVFLLILMLLHISLPTILFIYLGAFLLYLIWAIKKNVRYTKHGWYWLPILQLCADVMVMSGSVSGVLNLSKRHATLAQSR